MPAKSFEFKARLTHVEQKLVSTVIYLPENIKKQLPAKRVRAKGTMNGAPFALAVQYRKTGENHFIVSGPLRRAAKVKPGEMVLVKFKVVSDEVEVPEVLMAVLEQDPEGKEVWDSLSAGTQRSLTHYVNSVKNVDSKITRALFLVNKAKQGAYSKKKKDTDD